MAVLDPVKNFAICTVSTGYSDVATSVALTTGHGAKLPDPSTDGDFNLVWWNSTDYTNPSDDPNVEIIRVTARSTDTLTITRGQESTSGSTKNTGSKTYKMALVPTKKLIDDINASLMSFSDLGTDPTATLVANSSYLAQTSFFGSAVLTLPATANVGDRIAIQFKSGGVDTFRLSQQALQYIRYSTGVGFGTTTVGTGGYLQASNATFALEIICIEANIGWGVVNLTGSALQVEASSTYFTGIGFDTVTTQGTLLGATGTQTVVNKRIQPRTNSSTTNANLTPDLSTANVYYRTTQTGTLTINAPTGTPVIGETIMIYVDSASAQTLTINSTYKAFGVAFPSATTAGKTFMMSCQYNGTDWKTLWANAI